MLKYLATAKLSSFSGRSYKVNKITVPASSLHLPTKIKPKDKAAKAETSTL